MTMLEDDHDLGECERDSGFLCDECRMWFMERADDWKVGDEEDR